MANRAVFAYVDEILWRCMDNNRPFGGKVMLLLGDFRQTCPVIRNGSRVQVVHASIHSAPLWNIFTIHRLTLPIRNARNPEFAHFVDTIGDGAGPEVCIDMLNNCTSTKELI